MTERLPAMGALSRDRRRASVRWRTFCEIDVTWKSPYQLNNLMSASGWMAFRCPSDHCCHHFVRRLVCFQKENTDLSSFIRPNDIPSSQKCHMKNLLLILGSSEQTDRWPDGLPS